MRPNSDGVLIFTINRPEAKNAMNQAAAQGIAAHRLFPTNIAFGQGTIGGNGLLVSGSYFDLLGLVPTGWLLGLLGVVLLVSAIKTFQHAH